MDILTNYKKALTEQHNEQIKARAGLGLTLTAQERAKYILFLATTEQATKFLNGLK